MVYSYNDPKLYLDMLFDTYRRDGIELVERHVDILEEMAVTYANKNADYGDSFNRSLDKRGLISSLTRIEDKFNRFEQIVEGNDILVENETTRDTLMDMANYAVMTIMWLDKQEDEPDEPLTIFGERYADAGKPMFEETLLSKDAKARLEEQYGQGRDVSILEKKNRELNELYQKRKEQEEKVRQKLEPKVTLIGGEDVRNYFRHDVSIIENLKERLEKAEMDYIYSQNENKELRTLVEKVEDLARDVKAGKDFGELGEEGAWQLYQDSHMNGQLRLKLDDIPEEKSGGKEGFHTNVGRNLEENL